MSQCVRTAQMDVFLTADDIAAVLPSRIRGRKVTASTVRRWQLVGLKNGRIFLASRMVGPVRCSTPNDLQRFFDELTAADEAERHQLVDRPNLSPAKSKRTNDQQLAYYERLARERNL